MQINRIDTAVQKKASRKSSDRNVNNTSNPNFKGIGAGLDKIALGTANLIENGGLAVSFTLQDMLGTNLPRPIMGLTRNSKENKGEKNFKFAAKEVVREMLTGPSMFLIPMGLLAVGKKALGKTVNTPMNFIKDFGAIHAANPLDQAGKAISKEGFFKNTFAEILKNAKLEPEKISDTASQFATRLMDITSTVDKKEVARKMGELSDDFVAIAKKHADDVAFTDFTVAKISSKTAAPFKDAVEHMVSYADDMVAKAAKQTNTANLSKFVKNLSDKKILARAGMNVAMYAAVVGFLQIIPRLYNKAEGEGNAGLKGLMKEETLNDKALEQNQSKNKSNPSFGAGVPKPVIDTLTGEGKGVIGKALGKFAQWSEFSGCNMSFPFLLSLMGLGIFLPRLTQAKDKYDREEILRRDAVTCATMCFGEHELRKGFSKLNESNSGFVLADKGQGFKQQNLAKRFFDYIRPIKGVNVLSSDQIVSRYSDLSSYKGGIKGFCGFIDQQGGKLSKVLSLTDESKALTEKIVGRSINGLDNKTIRDAIANNVDSEDVKKLTDLFKDKNNPWVQKAKTLNARFTALSVLVLVPVFLGFLLPAINERATKKRIGQEKANELASQQKNMTANAPQNFFEQNTKTSKVFSDIANFQS